MKKQLKGKEITIGGDVYVLPALPYVAYEDYDAIGKIGALLKFAQSLGTGTFPEDSGTMFKNMRELLTLALKRNYPDIEDEFVKENISFQEMMNAFATLQKNEMEIQEVKAKIDEKNVEKPNADVN